VLAADAAEAVAARGHLLALEVDVDVVPVIERFQDRACGLLIGIGQVAQRLVREHHAPAEGVVGTVALHHRDLVCGILLLHQQAEIQTGWTAAYANNIHNVL
jgi:hypothetical protein